MAGLIDSIERDKDMASFGKDRKTVNGSADVLRSMITEQTNMKNRVQSLVTHGTVQDYDVAGVLGALDKLKDELGRAIAELERRG